ncbi:hypothetical protein BH11BAC2_BH11BAC2_17770 [soil metagenome]
MNKHSRFLTIIYGLLFFITLSGCNNDLDLIDDYRETPVIYGVLNPTDSTQYIRVQRAYLGPGNALLMAQVTDSIYYDTNLISVSIERYKNATLDTTWVLHPTTSINKEEGLFVDAPHLLYYTDKCRPKEGEDFKLVFKNNATGKEILGTTKIINPPTQLTLAAAFNINLANEAPYTIKIKTSRNAKMYGLEVRVKYLERKLTQNFYTQKTVTLQLPTQLSVGIAGGENMSFLVPGNDVYQLLGNKVPIDASVERPGSAVRIDFRFLIATQEFYTYYIVNQPNTASASIPDFTTLSDGKGIFTCRLDTLLKDYSLNSASIDSLVFGKFCPDRFN